MFSASSFAFSASSFATYAISGSTLFPPLIATAIPLKPIDNTPPKTDSTSTTQKK